MNYVLPIFINMQATATSLLETIIRQEISLLREQDDAEIKKLKRQIKKLKQEFEDATHEEQEDRITIKIEAIEQQIKDIESGDEDSDPTPDASWLGRPVPPPDQYNGKNGNASKQDLTTITLEAGRSNRPVKIILRADAMNAFQRVMKDMGAMGHTFLSEMKQVYSFRTYKSAYNLIDWDHWKKTGKWQTIDQNGKVYPAAKPGTSAHGIGLAMDFSSTNNINMMKKFGTKHGWIQNVPNDDPHFRYFPDRDKGK